MADLQKTKRWNVLAKSLICGISAFALLPLITGCSNTEEKTENVSVETSVSEPEVYEIPYKLISQKNEKGEPYNEFLWMHSSRDSSEYNLVGSKEKDGEISYNFLVVKNRDLETTLYPVDKNIEKLKVGNNIVNIDYRNPENVSGAILKAIIDQGIVSPEDYRYYDLEIKTLVLPEAFTQQKSEIRDGREFNFELLTKYDYSANENGDVFDIRSPRPVLMIKSGYSDKFPLYLPRSVEEIKIGDSVIPIPEEVRDKNALYDTYSDAYENKRLTQKTSDFIRLAIELYPQKLEIENTTSPKKSEYIEQKIIVDITANAKADLSEDIFFGKFPEDKETVVGTVRREVGSRYLTFTPDKDEQYQDSQLKKMFSEEGVRFVKQEDGYRVSREEFVGKIHPRSEPRGYGKHVLDLGNVDSEQNITFDKEANTLTIDKNTYIFSDNVNPDNEPLIRINGKDIPVSDRDNAQINEDIGKAQTPDLSVQVRELPECEFLVTNLKFDIGRQV